MIAHLRQGIRRSPAILIGCVLALLFYVVGLFEVWRWAEEPMKDFMQARRMRVHEAPDNIAIVQVDRSTLDTHGGGNWPLSRLAYATTLQALGGRGVSAVGFEMPLTERDPAAASFDAAFSRQLAKFPAVVMSAIGLQSGGETNRPPNLPALKAPGKSIGRLADHPQLMVPSPGLASGARLGLGNLPRGYSSALRSIPLVLRSGNTLVPSFFLQCLLAHEGLTTNDVKLDHEGRVEIRRRGHVVHRIPVDGYWRLALPWRMPRPEPPKVALDSLVLAAEQAAATMPGKAAPAFDLGLLGRKFVLVGRQAPETYDPVLTVRGNISPTEVLLLAWQTVFARDFAVPAPGWLLWLACAPLAVFLVWFAWRFHWAWSVLMVCFVAVDLWVLSFWLLSEFRTWLFAMPPSLLCVAAVAMGRWLCKAGPHRHVQVVAPAAKGSSSARMRYPPRWSGPP